MELSNGKGYLFGCCAACRAPIQPKTARNMAFPENQAVHYMIARFEQVSARQAVKSAFTSTEEQGHLVSRAKVGAAMQFCTSLADDILHQGLPADMKDPAVFSQAAGKKRTAQTEKKLQEDTKAVLDPGLSEEEKEKVAAELVEAISSAVSEEYGKSYKARWDAPATAVEHQALLKWVLDHEANLEKHTVNLEYTVACCTLCNDIWDCFGKIREAFESGIVAGGAVRTFTGKETTGVALPASGQNQRSQNMLGALAAYYLHACLKSMKDAGVADEALHKHRSSLLLLSWLPLHIQCMLKCLQEKAGSTSGGKPKGFHNYAGCLELLISYYLWTCGRMDPERAHRLDGVPFERYHVFYAKEAPEAPDSVWNLGEGRRNLYDFVFDDEYVHAGAGDFAKETSVVSDKLQALYQQVARRIAPTVKGGAGADPDCDAFFLTKQEADDFVKNRLVNAALDFDNLRLHMGNAGVTAILWQLRRSLQHEQGDFGKELDRWLFARMQVEWKNMALNAERPMSIERARGLYLRLHTLGGDLVESGPAAARPGRCSVWKAAHRLRATLFTTPPDLRRAYDGEEDSSGGEDEPEIYSTSTLTAGAQQGKPGQALLLLGGQGKQGLLSAGRRAGGACTGPAVPRTAPGAAPASAPWRLASWAAAAAGWLAPARRPRRGGRKQQAHLCT